MAIEEQFRTILLSPTSQHPALSIKNMNNLIPTHLCTTTRSLLHKISIPLSQTSSNIYKSRKQFSSMSSHDSQKEAKKALRSELKSRLSQLSIQDLTSQSEKAQHIILSSSQYKNAQRVGIYLSMPQSEAQTDILIRDALSASSSSQAKEVFVPYIYSIKNDGETSKKRTMKVMDMMRLETMEEYAGLEKDGWGIPKLSDRGIEERENAMGWKGLSLKADGARIANESNAAGGGGLDLIVVPAVAFDRKLNRLGHGAGFYDKFLTQNFGDEKSKKPYLFGLCLAEQSVPEGKLVMEPWDWRVDAVAVGDGTLLTSDDIQ